MKATLEDLKQAIEQYAIEDNAVTMEVKTNAILKYSTWGGHEILFDVPSSLEKYIKMLICS